MGVRHLCIREPQIITVTNFQFQQRYQELQLIIIKERYTYKEIVNNQAPTLKNINFEGKEQQMFLVSIINKIKT